MKKDVLSILDRIRLEAYLLSEKAGHPSGLDAFFWTQAEAIVHGRTAVVVGPGKTVKAKKSVVKATKTAVSAKSQPAPKTVKAAKPKPKSTGKRAK